MRKNIDTDQIIPARYLKAINKDSVADGLFADWRYNPDGTINKDFILNQPEYKNAQILLVGDNFGCGSSISFNLCLISPKILQVQRSPSISNLNPSHCRAGILLVLRSINSQRNVC
jgi:3-isopropylmalate/(R)-2-methylmalate dehydratase small subunit